MMFPPLRTALVGRRWIYSGDYRAEVTLCSIPNQTGKLRIADGTLA